MKTKTPIQRPRRKRKAASTRTIRYAVVGLGHISQVAVLPAFAHAPHSKLTALVSSDPKKLKSLGRRHRVENLYSYDQFDECLRSGLIDAIYIALPNDRHREYAERAAAAGIHVLCEKPMAITAEDCEAMIRATDSARVKLMIAYRLHFEETNLRAIELVRTGKIGEPRIFNSTFSMPVIDQGIRLAPDSRGGGPVFDIGIYCINASRYLFREEPIEVIATSATRDKKRFRNILETVSVILRFPGEKLATFTCTFGGVSTGSFEVVGNEGCLRVDNAYEYAGAKRLTLNIAGKKPKVREFAARDQFAPELEYFSDCILLDKSPEPSGWEGWANIRIIQAISQSVRTRAPVPLPWATKRERPNLSQEIHKPPVKEPKLVDTDAPGGQEAA